MAKKKQPVIVEDDSDEEDTQFVVGKLSYFHCLAEQVQIHFLLLEVVKAAKVEGGEWVRAPRRCCSRRWHANMSS